MAESKIQQSFGFFDRFSLATKGRILFLAPAIAQAILLVGLIIIQVETADFYPARTAQDRELADSLINMMNDNHAALRGISQSILAKTEPSSECNTSYQKMLLDEKELEKNWGEFSRRRSATSLPMFKSPALEAHWTKEGQDMSAFYRAVADSTTAAYEEARHADDPTMPKSEALAASNGRMTNSTLKGARNQETHLVMHETGQPFGPESGTRERDLWFTLLIAYSTINLLYLVGAAVIFIRSLVNRLQILNENGHRYIARQELLPRLGGLDEMAQLDNAFHDIGDVVQNSTRGHRLMMEKASDLICSLSKGGRIESVSNASFTVMGYEPDAMIGARLIDYIADEHQAKFLERLKTVAEQKGTATFETPAVRKDKVQIDLLWSITWSVADSSIFCITHDISETKRAERVQQELLQMVSHELRSPLVAISGFHEFAERGVLGALDAQGMRQIASAKRSTEQMLTLVNDLLEAERLDSGMLDIKKENIRLSEVIKTATNAVSAQAQLKHLRLEVQPGEPIVFADTHRLTQVMTHLLSNAVKMSREGGCIRIQTTALADALKVAVSDEGQGFPEQFKKTIFERYHQLRDQDPSKRSGSGLGLNICKALIDLHGGKIWVDTEQGQGSTFYFTIPNATSAEGTPTPAASKAPATQKRNPSNPSGGGGAT